MKPFVLALLLLSLSATSPAFAQPSPSAPDDLARSGSPEAFEKLKTLAGSWVGQLTTTPVEPSVQGNFAQLSLQVTSLGNAFVHEMSISGRPDHPVTMFYLEGDRLHLTHYCDAGNRPRMTGTVSPDGKSVEFAFLDLTGSDQYGHMYGAKFTLIDENHHVEEWTWMKPDGETVRMRLDLQRTNAGSETSGH